MTIMERHTLNPVVDFCIAPLVQRLCRNTKIHYREKSLKKNETKHRTAKKTPRASGVFLL